MSQSVCAFLGLLIALQEAYFSKANIGFSLGADCLKEIIVLEVGASIGKDFRWWCVQAVVQRLPFGLPTWEY